MDRTAYQDRTGERQGVSQQPDAPRRPLSDREFDELLDTTLYNSPAKQRALRRLRRRMDEQGRVALPGGVRGWCEALGCGQSRPRWILEGLGGDGLIALDIVRDGGAMVAEIVVVCAFDPSGIAATPQQEAIRVPHQDAENESSDPSGIDPPQTPHVDDHESMQQQQHGHAREGNAIPDRAFLTEFLLQEFPQADPALIAAWQADSRVDDLTMAYKALAGFPAATLADWRTDLAIAEHKRDDVGRPVGFVLAVWSKGGRVTADRRIGRSSDHKPAPRPSPLAGRVRSKLQQETVPGRRDIETAPDLRDAERERWLQRYDAVPPDEQPEVVHEFWTWWGEREQARRLAPDEPPPPPAAHAPNLNQFWQATLGTLQTQTSRQEFDTWLRGTVLIALEDGTATVRAASRSHQEGLEGRYQVPIRRALGDVVGRPVTVRIVVLQAAAAAN